MSAFIPFSSHLLFPNRSTPDALRSSYFLSSASKPTLYPTATTTNHHHHHNNNKPTPPVTTIKCTATSPSSSTTNNSSTSSSSSFSLSSSSSSSSETPFELIDNYVMKTYGRYQIAISHGEGCFLYDINGKKYLDFVAGIATTTLGHAHPALNKTVTDQIQKVHHVSNLFYIKEQGLLAKWLVNNSCFDKAFFCNSGAEANEGMIKLARRYAYDKHGVTDKNVIITMNSSFHGRTLATISATAQPKYQKGFAPLVQGFVYSDYNNIAQLRQTVDHILADGKHLTAIMMEPLQGEGGVRPADLEFLQEARALCDKHDALLLFDEVQVGVGRSGKFFAYQKFGVEPDALSLAKGLAGGIPIGALLCKEKFNVFGPGDHAATFGGNFLSCAAALTVIDQIQHHRLLENVNDRGEQLRAGLVALAAKYPNIIQQARGLGLINGCMIKDGAGYTSPEIVAKCIDKGLLVCPAGPQVVRFVPPLVISKDEVDLCLSIFDQVLATL